MHRHRSTTLVDRADSIRIAIRCQTDQRLRRDNAVFQRPEVLIYRFRIDSTEKWIAKRADGFYFEVSALQKTLYPGSCRSMHWINYDPSRSLSYQIEIDVGSNSMLISGRREWVSHESSNFGRVRYPAGVGTSMDLQSDL